MFCRFKSKLKAQSSKLKAQSSKNSKPVRIAWHLGNTFAIFAFFVTELCNASEPYCGVYCIQACRTILNRDGDFESLLSNKYVLGDQGSSVQSLQLAAKDCRLESAPFIAFGIFDLKLSRTPIILHVRSDRLDPGYNHWILYLGNNLDGTAHVYDPTFGAQDIKYSDLMSNWDGAGIVIANNRWQLWFQRAIAFSARLLLFLLVGCVGVYFSKVATRLHSSTHSLKYDAIGAASVLIFCSTTGVMFDSVSGSSVLWNTYACNLIQAIHMQQDFPEVSTHQLGDWITNDTSDNSIVLIDARMAKDFRHYPLPKAINLPVDCSLNFENKLVENIPTDRKLVVYCQSKGCLYSDRVAKRLRARGYKSIIIYRDGAIAWRNKKDKPKPVGEPTS